MTRAIALATLLLGLAACGASQATDGGPAGVDAGGCADGTREGDPSSTMTCSFNDAGCGFTEATCCSGVLRCPTDTALVPRSALEQGCVGYPLYGCN